MRKIEDILKEKGIKVSWLQRKTGISRYSLDLIIKGLKSPTIEEVKKIAEALKIPISDILIEINV